jgi:hypothetical protein
VFLLSEGTNSNMAAKQSNVVFLASRSRDWSQNELAEFYRVEGALIRNGLAVVSDRGLTDEGDPWFIFFREDEQEPLVHFARIGSEYIIVSAAYGGILKGKNFKEMILDLLSRHRISSEDFSRSSNVFLHPAALLITLVGVAFFKVQSPAEAGEANVSMIHEKKSGASDLSRSANSSKQRQPENVNMFVQNKDQWTESNTSVLLAAIFDGLAASVSAYNTGLYCHGMPELNDAVLDVRQNSSGSFFKFNNKLVSNPVLRSGDVIEQLFGEENIGLTDFMAIAKDAETLFGMIWNISSLNSAYEFFDYVEISNSIKKATNASTNGWLGDERSLVAFSDFMPMKFPIEQTQSGSFMTSRSVTEQSGDLYAASLPSAYSTASASISSERILSNNSFKFSSSTIIQQLVADDISASAYEFLKIFFGSDMPPAITLDVYEGQILQIEQFRPVFLGSAYIQPENQLAYSDPSDGEDSVQTFLPEYVDWSFPRPDKEALIYETRNLSGQADGMLNTNFEDRHGSSLLSNGSIINILESFIEQFPKFNFINLDGESFIFLTSSALDNARSLEEISINFADGSFIGLIGQPGDFQNFLSSSWN